jgi:hypothetical protein
MVATVRSRVARVLVLLFVGVSPPAVLRAAGQNDRAPDSRASSMNVIFREMAFELPGSDWRRQENDQQVSFARNDNKPGHSQLVSVWSVPVAGPGSRQASQDHAASYFNLERHQARPPGVRWEGFMEGLRTIGTSSYPIMTFSIRAPTAEADGLFLLYFPSDFQERQRFYCFMVQDIRQSGTEAPKLDLPMLDGIVSSFHLGGTLSPPASNTAAFKGGEGLVAPTLRDQVERLLRLSDTSASDAATSTAPSKALALKCAELIDKHPNYSSFARLTDRSVTALESRDFIAESWTFDHQGPDRYHVTQSLWNGSSAYFYDEWITIGKAHFDFAGLWIERSDPVRVDLNRKLGMQKYLQLLRKEQPRSGRTQTYDGQAYALVTYVVPFTGDLQAFLGTGEGMAEVQLWIDSSSTLLTKARVGRASPGVSARELQQVFVGYDGHIQIKAPTAPSRK